MLLKNTGGQGVYLFAYTTATGLPKTGDAANITGTVSKDGAAAAATATAHPTEIGGGLYWQPLSQAETNGNAIALAWASTTAGVQIDPLTGFTGVVTLDATGLDAIPVADPGPPSAQTTFPKRMVAVWRHSFKLVTKSKTQIIDYADDGTTPNATRAISDDGAGNQVQGAAV